MLVDPFKVASWSTRQAMFRVNDFIAAICLIVAVRPIPEGHPLRAQLAALSARFPPAGAEEGATNQAAANEVPAEGDPSEES